MYINVQCFAPRGQIFSMWDNTRQNKCKGCLDRRLILYIYFKGTFFRSTDNQKSKILLALH